MPRASGTSEPSVAAIYLDASHALYPNASCRLIFHNDFECLIAIILSAQTSDEAVNKVTPHLFGLYPTPNAMADAPLSRISDRIRSIGLYKNKARFLKETSLAIRDRFGSVVPSTREELESLPGVGHKTAGVFLMERRNIPAFPVDTHVSRVSKRIGFASKSKNPSQIEAILEKLFPQNEWIFAHHATIMFGRDICLAKKPRCGECPLKKRCHHSKYTLSTTGR